MKKCLQNLSYFNIKALKFKFKKFFIHKKNSSLNIISVSLFTSHFEIPKSIVLTKTKGSMTSVKLDDPVITTFTNKKF